MKNYKPILHSIGTREGEGIYDEESDGNHRCYGCNKKMRTGQEATSRTSPNTRGYRRNDTVYCHKVCPNST